MCFIFPGEQYVTDFTLGKGCGRAARARIQNGNILIKRGHEVAGFGFIVSVFAIRVTPGRKIAPAPATRRFRIGSDDLDAGFDYIRPIFYVFRISFAYQEDDGRGVGCAIVRKFSLPIQREKTFIGESVNVIPQTEGHHVSLKTVNYGTRLLAGTTGGENDGDISTGLFRP